MRKFFLFTIVFTSVMISSCEQNDVVIQASLLEKGWTHSFEEKTSGEIEIYRPGDYKDFPLSRYRQMFNFEANNVCDYRVLAANDGHHMETGRWEYKKKKNVIRIFNSKSVMIYEFDILELTDNLLKMKAKN